MISAWIGTIATVVLVLIMVIQVVRVEVKLRRSKHELAARVRDICTDERTPPPMVMEIRRRTGNQTGRMR